MNKDVKIKTGVKPYGVWKFDVRDVAGNLIRRTVKKNLIPTIGLVALAAQLSGQNTTNIGDNLYIAIGDSTTAPSLSDLLLGNETARKAPGSSEYSNTTTATIVVFFAPGEATGTHKEFGLFGDGKDSVASATADTGILFSHVSADVNVGATESLTITYEVEFV